MDKKIIYSGIQPTGVVTLGNYIGALQNWLKLQDDTNYQCIYSIADLHSLTVRQVPAEFRNRALSFFAQYLACGLDPQKNIMYFQSHVHEHTELTWILNCFTYVGEASRMTQFKEKSQKHPDNINMGLMDYPVLMAADILIYNANLVPVGDDQKQHLEITRDIAQRFNSIYGETFVLPEPYISNCGERIMGLQNPLSKMSKSTTNLNDAIFLTDEPDEIRKKLKKAVTDSENCVRYDVKNKPGVSNLMTIYSLMKEKSFDEIEEEFKNKGYGDFKMAVAEAIIDKLEPVQKKYNELMSNPEELKVIYEKGDKKAKEKTEKLLKEVYRKIGLIV